MSRRSLLLMVVLLLLLLPACSAADPGAGGVISTATLPAATTPAPEETPPASATPARAGGTPLPPPSATPSPRPPLAAGAWQSLPVVPTLSPAMRAVYQHGLALGNDVRAFSVVGDCQNVSSYFLAMFDEPGEYALGSQYQYLQDTIDYYQGSFSRPRVAAHGGYNVASILSPLRSDPKLCSRSESPLECELRLSRPAVVLVSLEEGWGSRPAETYGKYMRQVVEIILAHGTIPILATKADNVEGDHSINAMIAQIAWEYDVPLWNFWLAVQPLPDRGLSPDGFHLTYARSFFDDPERMQSAWPWRNLTALQALDSVRRGLDAPTPTP